MNRIFYLIFVLFIICCVTCKKSPPRALSDEIADYKSGKLISLEPVKMKFLEKITKKKINGNNITIHPQFLCSVAKDVLNIEYPVEEEVPFKTAFSTEKVSLDRDIFAYFANGTIILYNMKNRFEVKVEPADKELSALCMIDDSLYYILNKKLYVYDVMEDRQREFVSKQFRTPYNKLYHILFNNDHEYMVFSFGIAGSYYINVIDYKKKDILVTDISAASSKSCLLDDSLVYISGSSGNWRLTGFNLFNKSKKFYRTFKDLVDIHITPNAYVFENSKGTWVSDYTDEIKIPFDFSIEGVVMNDLVIKYNKIYFVLDAADLYNELVALKTRLPAVF